MGTHATIAIKIHHKGVVSKLGNGKYLVSTLSSDGYLSHAGSILQQFYKEESRVIELISLGDLSFVGRYISKEEAEADGDLGRYSYTTAYHRDRDEDWNSVAPRELSWDDMLDDTYTYVFDDGHWYFVNGYDDDLVDLTNLSCSELDELDESL